MCQNNAVEASTEEPQDGDRMDSNLGGCTQGSARDSGSSNTWEHFWLSLTNTTNLEMLSIAKQNWSDPQETEQILGSSALQRSYFSNLDTDGWNNITCSTKSSISKSQIPCSVPIFASRWTKPRRTDPIVHICPVGNDQSDVQGNYGSNEDLCWRRNFGESSQRPANDCQQAHAYLSATLCEALTSFYVLLGSEWFRFQSSDCPICSREPCSRI